MVVYSLATAVGVKRWVAQMTHGIRAGRVQPGSSLSLRDAAEQLGVTGSALAAQLRGLAAEGLLVINGDGTATVAPLDAQELTSLMRLMRLTRPALHAQAAARRTSREAERLDAQFRAAVAQHPQNTDGAWRVQIQTGEQQIQAVVTRPERDLMHTLAMALQRYARIAAATWQDPHFAAAWISEVWGSSKRIGAEDYDTVHDAELRALWATESLLRSSLAFAPSDAATSRTFAGTRPALRLI